MTTSATLDRECPVHLAALHHVGDAGVAAGRRTEDADVALRRREQAGDRLEERGLAGPVRAHHGQPFARLQRATHILQDQAILVVDAQAVHVQRGLLRRVRDVPEEQG
jgi:hypothetical protein